MGLGIRFFLSLFAMLPAALLAVMLLHLAPPPGLPSLAHRPVWTAWALLGLWFLMSVVLAWRTQREVRRWRISLGTLAVLLAAAAAYGLWHRQPMALAVALSLGGLAVAALVMGCAIKAKPPARRAGPKRTKVDHVGPAAPASASAELIVGAPRSGGAVGRRVLEHLLRHGGFWLVGILMLESFRLAYVAGVDPERGVGMVGMLLSFFLVLPALSLASWLPGIAAVLIAVAVCCFLALGWLSGLWPPFVAAAALAIALAQVHRVSVAAGPQRAVHD